VNRGRQAGRAAAHDQAVERFQIGQSYEAFIAQGDVGNIIGLAGSDGAPPTTHYHGINSQHDDGSYDGSDKSGTLSRPVPAQSLPKKCRDEGAHDPQNRCENETGWLVFAGHNELSNHSGDEADYDGPQNAHVEFTSLDWNEG
jgi:hypothetical protein